MVGGYLRLRAAVIATAILAVAGSWFHARWITFPPPNLCGSPGGPPVTASRIRLKDGRHLAYYEFGVPKEHAKYKIVFVHGFLSSPETGFNPTSEVMEELGVYMVGYDRAGYRQSDPNPNRSVEGEAMDVEQLADAMQLGSRFYVIGYSLGGHAIWGSLKHIPHRLAGAALMSPVINHNWPGFPKNLSGEARSRYDVGDRWVFKVAYHAPWLLNWWLSQPFLPSFSVIDGTTHCPNKLDAEYIDEKHRNGEFAIGFKEATQQGIHESLYRDLMVMFGKWKFVPVDLSPPPVSVPVHLFQGDEDGLVPVSLQRYIVGRLKWINYHELPSTGHYLTAIPAFGDRVLKTLLLSNHS